MKKKIFLNMCLVALVAVLFTTLLSVFVVFQDSRSTMQAQTVSESKYVVKAYDEIGSDYFLGLSTNINSRITHISADGQVLFDSRANSQSMENHFDRPEIQEALSKGVGTATRLSNTINQETYYYAVLLSDGTILRVANTMNTVYATLLAMLPWAILIVIVTLIISAALARYQTKLIVKPINEINLDEPAENVIYEEFTPLLSRMEKQQEQIRRQIAELAKKQNEFSAITENMQEGFILIDNKTNVLSVNSSALELFGAHEHQTNGPSVFAINRSLEFTGVVDSALKGKGERKIFKLGSKHVEVYANPVFVYGSITGVVILALDITEKQKRDEFRREFTANVSHELKTPLTSISGYAEIIMNGLAKPEDVKGFAKSIYTEAQRLIVLILDIINLSRLDDSDELNFKKQNVNILDMCNSIKDRLNQQIEIKNIDFKVNGQPIVISAIPQLLDEMLFNVLDNGIKYNKVGGKLCVDITKSGNKNQIKITDSGIGIPKKDLDRVFERFYRVDKSHSKETGGTGLGLSIVKHCVQIHKGTIEISSEVGKGTEIIITLP